MLYRRIFPSCVKDIMPFDCLCDVFVYLHTEHLPLVHRLHYNTFQALSAKSPLVQQRTKEWTQSFQMDSNAMCEMINFSHMAVQWWSDHHVGYWYSIQRGPNILSTWLMSVYINKMQLSYLLLKLKTKITITSKTKANIFCPGLTIKLWYILYINKQQRVNDISFFLFFGKLRIFSPLTETDTHVAAVVTDVIIQFISVLCALLLHQTASHHSSIP